MNTTTLDLKQMEMQIEHQQLQAQKAA